MDIYDPKFVENLFNRMSKTYGLANYISSFGFTERWRKQCVREIKWTSEMKIGYDFMSGMGECWNLINNKCSHSHQLKGVDISPAMNKEANDNLNKYNSLQIEVIQEDVLQNSIESNSADYIISTFGLKTFSEDQLATLAKQIKRILKPRGQFSLIEISKPNNKLLVLSYMFYLKLMIPLIGKIFMGNSDDYRMLGVYCSNFKDCTKFKKLLQQEGLEVEMKEYFGGCATGVSGIKKG